MSRPRETPQPSGGRSHTGLGLFLVLSAAAAFPALAQAAETEPLAVPPATQPAAPQAADDSAVQIYMPDGQLSSNPLLVYVTRDIVKGQSPRLRLFRKQPPTAADTEAEEGTGVAPVGEAEVLEPVVVAPDQTWTMTVKGRQVSRSGTVLLFDASGAIDFGVKAMLRVRPMVSWTEDGAPRMAVGERDVNVGHRRNTVLWTGLVVAGTLLIVVMLAKRAAGSALRLLTGASGQLSLAQSQIACWTIVVGSVVLGYGLVRLAIPEIPASLLVLMGASLTTGGIGFFKDAQKSASATGAPAPPPGGSTPALALSDLVRDFSSANPQELSLAKAQMLFWTLLLLVLFVVKSLFEGAIWEVPWPLVALMGFSQAGYLAPKLVR